MEYQVPQFIEVEDKIFGPFTLAQFIYVAGGLGLCAIAFVYLPFLLAVLISIPVLAFAGALAFYKVNNKPFIDVVQSAFGYFTGGKLYLWKKDSDSTSPMTSVAPAPVVDPNNRQALGITAGKLHELAWSLDVKSPEGESPLP
jgi:hypothetical protein